MDLKYMVLKYEWPYKRLDISLWIIHHQVLNHNLPRQSLSHSLISWLIAELLFVLSNTCFLWARTWKNHKCCINKVCIIMMSKSLSFCNPTQFKFWKIKYVFNTQSFIHICCPMENLSINDDQVHTLNYLRLCFRICPLNIPCVWNCFCLEPLQYITIKFWF